MWDSEWDEDPEDFYNYRHQRRLSDPSASLTNFNRYGAWRTKGGQETNASAGAKSRSENEGLDKWIDEVSEIEAGDLKDGEFNIFLKKKKTFLHYFEIHACFFYTQFLFSLNFKKYFI